MPSHDPPKWPLWTVKYDVLYTNDAMLIGQTITLAAPDARYASLIFWRDGRHEVFNVKQITLRGVEAQADE